MEKTQVRALVRARKKAMTPEQIARCSQDLTRQLLESPVYRSAESLYGYLPYNQEVLTWGLLEQAMKDGKRVAVPKVYGDTMKFLWIKDFSGIALGYCNIPEPVADGPVAEDPRALILMPGLAFDRMGHRVGYGGGFYDKFLAQEPNHPTVALCYGFQMFDEIQADTFDKPVELVLSSTVEDA